MIEMLIKKMMEDKEDEEQKKVRIGKVSPELVKRMESLKREHRAEHVAIKEKVEAYIEKVTAEHDCDAFNLLKSELWEEVYDELNLTQAERGEGYGINHLTGVVSRYVDED